MRKISLVAGSLAAIGAIIYFQYSTRGYQSATPLYLDLPPHFSAIASPADNPLTNQGVELGRLLFYDKSLSKDGSVSCASCHQQQLAFTDGKAMSVGMDRQATDFGALSLANVAFVSHLTWEGHDSSLEIQALKPIVRIREMDQRLVVLTAKLQSSKLYREKFAAAFGNEPITPKLAAKALAQFQRTLISPDSKYDRYLLGEAELTDLELKGLELFSESPDPNKGVRGAGCISCHQGVLFQGSQVGFEAFRNNGLYPEPWAGLIRNTGVSEDLGKFRIPSLRNIEVTGPYMHTGVFTTLEDVLDHYSDGIQYSATIDTLVLRSNDTAFDNGVYGLKLRNHEKKAIIAFLKTLTDHQFLADPKFSDPFEAALD